MKNLFPLALSFDDVLLVPQYSKIASRQDVDLTTKISPNLTLKLPLISVNMSDVTGVEMAIAIGKLGGLGFLHRFVEDDAQADMVAAVDKAGVVAAAAIGIKSGYQERAEKLIKAGVKVITVDVAHGAMQRVIDVTSYLKNKYKDITLIPGVVATRDGAEALFKAGADSVRVGVGPGSICTTRTQTGFGVPQITATIEAVKAAKKYKKTVLCDGGTKNSGDVMKALAAGAVAVVIGGQFAGTDEAPGKIVVIKGKKYKAYNASTSLSEKKNHVKELTDTKKNYLDHIEGVESFVPYKGPVEKIVRRLEANLKSGFSYCGSENIDKLWQKAHFIQITQAGVRESGVHDVLQLR